MRKDKSQVCRQTQLRNDWLEVVPIGAEAMQPDNAALGFIACHDLNGVGCLHAPAPAFNKAAQCSAENRENTK
jgi:hypothetical protein